MKITNSDIIKRGEKDLIDAVTADLDWGALEEIFGKEHKLGIEEDVEYKKGDIVVHDNQVAYELEFEVKVRLSVLVDRDGNYLSVTSTADLDKTQDENEGELLEKPEEPARVPEEDAGNDLEGLADTGGDFQTESDGSTEEEKETDLQGSIDAGEDLQTEDEPEEAPTNEDVAESEDEYKQALEELDSTDDPENSDEMPPVSPPEDSEERIARMVSQAGDMIAEMDDKE